MSNSKITTQQFILESKQKFQDKFDYSLTEYINKNIPLILICPENFKISFSNQNYVIGKYSLWGKSFITCFE